MATVLQWAYVGNEINFTGSNAAAYSDFKTALAQTGFRGDIYYTDAAGSFIARGIDYVRGYIHALQLSASSGSQKPSTFNTDFAGAIPVAANGAIFSVTS
jgi:hypothetical protein